MASSSGLQAVNVLVQRFSGIEAVFDAVESGHQDGPKRPDSRCRKDRGSGIRAAWPWGKGEYMGMRMAALRFRLE